MLQLMFAVFLTGGYDMRIEWSELAVHFFGPVDITSEPTTRSEIMASLDSLLAVTPLDAERTLGDAVRRSQDADNYFETSLAYPQVVSTRYSTSGEILNEYSISLFGPFLEEFIPRSYGVNLRTGNESIDTTSEEITTSIPITGFVIDARGTGFNPAIFPRILDSQGRVILDASMVKRSQILERGYIKYAYTPRQALETRELGLNPLRIVAERAEGRNRSNIVLNSEDATLVTSSALNQKLLTECRVIVIVDEN
ncbi:hypothetical protein GX441_04245 [bacterium]|nr:hypothetical protein [bacterium]